MASWRDYVAWFRQPRPQTNNVNQGDFIVFDDAPAFSLINEPSIDYIGMLSPKVAADLAEELYEFRQQQGSTEYKTMKQYPHNYLGTYARDFEEANIPIPSRQPYNLRTDVGDVDKDAETGFSSDEEEEYEEEEYDDSEETFEIQTFKVREISEREADLIARALNFSKKAQLAEFINSHVVIDDDYRSDRPLFVPREYVVAETV